MYDKNPKYKSIVLFLTNKMCCINNQCCHQIENGLNDYIDFKIVFHKNGQNFNLTSEKYYTFTNLDLYNLGFKQIGNKNILPINCHFPILKFYKDFPNYKYYWVIEDDVRFNGDWSVFFNSFKNVESDFLSSIVRQWVNDPKWYWWYSLKHRKKNIPLNMRVASFNPIYRISNAALKFIYDALLDGWEGHHEVLLPTLLYHNDYTINDIGGYGDYVLPGYEGLFYVSDSIKSNDEITMKYRPVFHVVGKSINKIYHPVKDFNFVNNKLNNFNGI